MNLVETERRSTCWPSSPSLSLDDGGLETLRMSILLRPDDKDGDFCFLCSLSPRPKKLGVLGEGGSGGFDASGVFLTGGVGWRPGSLRMTGPGRLGVTFAASLAFLACSCSAVSVDGGLISLQTTARGDVEPGACGSNSGSTVEA